jgi:hypothetical protein
MRAGRPAERGASGRQSGVELDNAHEFLNGGACSVGLVAPLFNPEVRPVPPPAPPPGVARRAAVLRPLPDLPNAPRAPEPRSAETCLGGRRTSPRATGTASRRRPRWCATTWPSAARTRGKRACGYAAGPRPTRFSRISSPQPAGARQERHCNETWSGTAAGGGSRGCAAACLCLHEPCPRSQMEAVARRVGSDLGAA